MSHLQALVVLLIMDVLGVRCCWKTSLRTPKSVPQLYLIEFGYISRAQPKGNWPPLINLLSVNIGCEDEEYICEIVLGAFTESRKLSP